MRIDRIVWSRDRLEGGFTDRLPTRYRIEAAVHPNAWRTIASSDDRAPLASSVKVQAPPPGLTGDEQAVYKELTGRQKQLAARLRTLTAPTMAYAGQFTRPELTHLLHRGEIAQKKELVAPAAPSEFGVRMALPADTPEQERRLALARWITDTKNPLTARVMVNRIWQHHFGTGIVATPSDFGLNGARPSHPELLDWLADEFVARSWRMKAIHRLIVSSSTYRQASTGNPKAQAKDAATRLLWRYPPRRLEAEPLRDAILAVSGKLDLTKGGPGFDLFEPNTAYVKLYTPKKVLAPAEWRRMIYQSKPRMHLDDVFGAFDCPDAGQTAPTRTSSTTPLQAFNLLNSPFMLQQAGFFAERLRKEAGADVADQVRRGFWLAYQRAAEAEEIAEAVTLIRQHGLKAFCLGLFEHERVLVRVLMGSVTPLASRECGGTFPTCRPPARWKRAATPRGGSKKTALRSLAMLSHAGRHLLDRRTFLRDGGTGLGGIALVSLLAERGLLAAETMIPSARSSAPRRRWLRGRRTSRPKPAGC